MENTYFTILKWWIAQRKQDKLFVVFIVIIATVGIVSIKIYGQKEVVQQQKEAIQQSRFEDRKEYERQADIKADKAERRSDSLREADKEECEKRFENEYNEKKQSIKTRSEKIDKALK